MGSDDNATWQADQYLNLMVSHDFKCGEIDCGLVDWTAGLDYRISFNGIT